MVGAGFLQIFYWTVKGKPFGDAQCQFVLALQLFVDEEIFPSGVVLRGGDTPAGGVLQGQFDGAAPHQFRRRGNKTADQSHGRLAHNAGRLAISIAVDLAALRVFCLPGDGRSFERCCIRHEDVTIHAGEDGRIGAAHFVEVGARGQHLLRPFGVVPAASGDPLAGRGRLHAVGDALLHLLQRLGPNEIHVQLLEAAITEVQVGVVEARHHESAAEVHHLGVMAGQFADG